MNIDWNLVNRAMLLIGQFILSPEDLNSSKPTALMVKTFYLATFLEALSEIPWISGRRRVYLMRSGVSHVRNTEFRFAYDMPFDCALPIELRDKAYFITENKFIYTDQEHAELVYVTNGKILRTISAVRPGRPGDLMEMEYFSAGRPGDKAEIEAVFNPGTIQDIGNAIPDDPRIDEDYPDYRMPRYEPKLYQYVETLLAAKCAAQMSEQSELATRLLQQAYLVKEEAVTASLSAAAGPRKPMKWWGEQLGIKNSRRTREG
jgi:hypothetical protein